MCHRLRIHVVSEVFLVIVLLISTFALRFTSTVVPSLLSIPALQYRHISIWYLVQWDTMGKLDGWKWRHHIVSHEVVNHMSHGVRHTL
jgi:hypothetical protein